MELELQKKIAERFAELPEDIQRAIKSAEVDKKIREIASKNRLHIDQSAALGDEIFMAMLGLSEIADLADNIVAHVRVTSDQAETIAQDIGTTLFMPIRKSMQEFMNERELEVALLAEKMPPKIAPRTSTPPVPTPTPAPISTPQAAPTPKPAAAHPADMMLSQKTVTTAPPATPKPTATTPAQPSAPAPVVKPEPPKPGPYKADPYREPIQ